MARRVIIEARDGIDPLDAMAHVQVVMGKGRISRYGTQYCHYTTFKDNVAVASFLNKSSDRFVVTRIPDIKPAQPS